MKNDNQPKDLTGTNQFYLIVNSSGHFMKTSFVNDFKVVSNWGGIIFADKISSSGFVYLKCGSQWIKKKISTLPISKNSEQTLWYDVNEFDLKNCSSIQKIKIGGSKIPETYEKL